MFRRLSIRLFGPALVLLCLAGPALAAPQPGCLDRLEQRGMVATGRVIPFAVARRMIPARDGDEMLRARLCHGAGGLIWHVTLLSRTGQVREVAIDARNGALISGR
jgi:uncharacterized membrane protein YkoI